MKRAIVTIGIVLALALSACSDNSATTGSTTFWR